MRLRVLDLNTPWFWLTIFYEPKYGEPYLVASLWPPHKWQKWWIHVWQREAIPSKQGQYAAFAGQPQHDQGKAGE